MTLQSDHLKAMDQRASDVAQRLKLVANPQRLRIVCALMQGEMAVGEIEKGLGIKQPNLSRELSKLREAGCVATRREAKAVFYSLREGPLPALINALCLLEKADETPASNYQQENQND